MVEGDKKRARAEIRKQLDQLEAELTAVVQDRQKAETAVEESRKRTQELLARSSNIANREGILRKKIGELQHALEGLRG